MRLSDTYFVLAGLVVVLVEAEGVTVIVLVEAEGVTLTVFVVVLWRRQVVVVDTRVVVVVVVLGRRVQLEIVLESDCCKKNNIWEPGEDNQTDSVEYIRRNGASGFRRGDGLGRRRGSAASLWFCLRQSIGDGQ